MIQVSIEFALGLGVGILLAVVLRDASVFRGLWQSLSGCLMGIVFLIAGFILLGYVLRGA